VNETFAYKDGELHAEGRAVAEIAAAVGTPFYLYSAAGFVGQYRRFAAAFAPISYAQKGPLGCAGTSKAERPLVCYSVKANSNLAVLRLCAGLGAGADVVSEGELRRALAAGVPPQRIIFSGVGKAPAELAAALAARIHQINVESLPELSRLSALAASRNQTAPIAIRVNPDIDAGTHAKIATGKKENKFGIDLDRAVEAYRFAAALPGIAPKGLAVHIGSQLVDLEPFRRAFTRLAELVRELRLSGLPVERLDLGGGVGIRYNAEPAFDLDAYARLVRTLLAPLGVALAFEPGRFLAGPAGLLVARVLYVKEGAQRRFVILDAAMNDLIRPTLYDAWHDVLPVRRPPSDAVFAPADLVGPVCESGDTFAVDRDLPPLAEGDLVALATAGAYGAVMSSTYNSRLLVPEVLVAGERFAVIRQRPSYADLLSLDRIPGWLGELAEGAGEGGAA
jgi:diaminopimelate decarboxylase